MKQYAVKIINTVRHFFSSRYYSFVYGHKYLNHSQISVLKDLVSSKNSNKIIYEFEDYLSSKVGTGSSVSFSAGRMGFFALMQMLGIKKGDEVILLGHTCSVMPNAVLRIGATPIFADIDSNTFGSSAEEIKKVITAKTKMIVAQHSFGIPCDIEPIVDLAKSKGIFLLEDCALTFCSKINGVSVGNFGDAALFSIDHSKPLNAFIGGLIYTRENKFYKKLKEIQKASEELPQERQEAIWGKLLFERKYYNSTSYGKSFLIDKLNRIFLGEKDSYLADDSEKEPSSTYPYPAKLPGFLAQLGLFELERWEDEKKRRQNLLKSFIELSDSLGLTKFLPASYFDSNLDIIPLRFVYTHPDANVIRKKMSKFLDISWFWFDKPIVACSDPRELGYEYGSCPISEKIGKEVINWPFIISETDNNNLIAYFKMVHS